MQALQNNDKQSDDLEASDVAKQPDNALSVEEVGGVKGPEPTRYGDWEKNGRCVDF